MNTSIEENIFKRTNIDFSKLARFGFKKLDAVWIYEQTVMNDDFKAIIQISPKGAVTGKVYEIATEDEYLPLRVETMEGFAQEVRTAYEQILTDIKAHCGHDNLFVHPQANRLTDWIEKTFGDKPQFPWDKFDGYGVFKNPDNNKWYAIIMNIDKKKLDKKKSGPVEIVNFKLAPETIQTLLKENGFFPAYHMNKKSWITVVLDDTVSDKVLFDLVQQSHAFTVRKSK